MTINHMDYGATMPSGAKSRRRQRPRVASGDGRRAENLLRGALAREKALLHRLDELIQYQQDSVNQERASQAESAKHFANLTPRQRQIMELVLAGHSNKNIAADLGISQRTVENHRAKIMKRSGSKSLPALARLALAAAGNGGTDPTR